MSIAIHGVALNVTDIEQIEAVVAGYLVHLHGQGQRVGRVLEEWVILRLQENQCLVL